MSTKRFVKILRPLRRRTFSPDKAFKRKVKQTYDQRKAAVQPKKDAKKAELAEDEDDDDDEDDEDDDEEE